MKNKYDAIVVLCGGLKKNGTPHEWVKRRLDLTFKIHRKAKYIVIPGKSTALKPPILDKRRFPLDESVASARYLERRGVPKSKIIVARFSQDTIGDAYFTRVNVTDPLSLKNLLIITSHHHLSRTRAIFKKVFSLTPLSLKYHLDFFEVSDEGLDHRIIAARKKKEIENLKRFTKNVGPIKNFKELHYWILTQHGVYSYGGKIPHLKPLILASY